MTPQSYRMYTELYDACDHGNVIYDIYVACDEHVNDVYMVYLYNLQDVIITYHVVYVKYI